MFPLLANFLVRLPWQCNFEFGFCAMSQRTDDQFDWTRTNEPTPSSDTGPSAAQSGAWFIFIETSQPRVNGDAAAYVDSKLLNIYSNIIFFVRIFRTNVYF